MKNSNKIILSLIMLTSGQITAAQLNPELSLEEQEVADLAEAIRRSQNPAEQVQAVDPALAQALLYSEIDKEIKVRGGVNKLRGDGNETRTLLMDYATTGDLPAVKYLIDKGADLKVEDSYYGVGNPGRTAIVFAAYFGHADVVEYLASDRFPKIDTTEARKWADGGLQNVHKNQTVYDRIMAALDRIDAKSALQFPFARGGQAASLALQQPMTDVAGDITEDELRQIEAQIEGAQELENRLEDLAEQGNYFLEISENPEILELDGQRYTLRQLFTLRQSKVTGKFQQGQPDDTCFAQATKNCAAIIARNDSMDNDELAPLVLMNSAIASFYRINSRLASTEPPEGTEISRDESGYYHNVDIEFASKMLTESQMHEQFYKNLIILNQKGLENLMSPRDEAGLVADMQMLENGGAEFFKYYQISNHALYIIDLWRRREIMSIGIILQIEGHYIAIVFNQNNPDNIEVLVADSTFGVNRVNDPWMTANVYVPLINLLQRFDISNWLRALQAGQQRQGDLMRGQGEDEDQGGGFSLFN